MKFIVAKYFPAPSSSAGSKGSSSKVELATMLSSSKGGRRGQPLSSSSTADEEKHQNRWKDVVFVFANCAVSLFFFFLIALFLTPTLTSALVVTAGVSNDIVPIGTKIMCILLALILAGSGVYFVVWAVYMRYPRREKYIIDQAQIAEQNKKKNLNVADLFKYYCRPDGEWKIIRDSPTNNVGEKKKSNAVSISRKSFPVADEDTDRQEKETNQFLMSIPCFKSYRKNEWFAIVEIVTSILVCFPPLFAQFASNGRDSCIIQGSLLFAILLVYTVLVIWKNPKKLKVIRILFPILAIQHLIVVLMVLIAILTRDDNDDENQNNNNNGNGRSVLQATEESWLWKTIFVPMGFSVFLSILAILLIIFPFLSFLKKLRDRLKKTGEQFGEKRNNNNLMNYDEDDLEMELLGNNNYNRSPRNKHSNSGHHGSGRSEGRRRHSSGRYDDDDEKYERRHHHHNRDRDRRHHGSRDEKPNDRSPRRHDNSSVRDHHHHHHHHDRDHRRKSDHTKRSERERDDDHLNLLDHHHHRSFKISSSNSYYDRRRSTHRGYDNGDQYRRRVQSDDKRSPRSGEEHRHHRDEDSTIHHHRSSIRHSPRGQEEDDDDSHFYHQHHSSSSMKKQNRSSNDPSHLRPHSSSSRKF